MCDIASKQFSSDRSNVQKLTLQQIPREPAATDLSLYPDYLIGCLLREGLGRIEADYSSQRDGVVDFIFTPQGTGSSKVVARLGTGYFRSLLARVAAKCGDDMLYGGHALFYCEQERDGRILVHRFSLFICNLQHAGFWLRLYLYSVSDA